MSAVALERAAASGRIDGAPAPVWRRALVFGTGLGIAIGERNLEIAITRARPSGASVEGLSTVADFRSRPAAEWGAEVQRLVAAAGESRLAATLLLPRDETIVRTLALPGVSDKDAAGAIELQIDSLHPWGDADVAWGWSRAGRDNILIGLTRKETLEAWETLFTEAGIPVAAITFSAAVFYAALRIWNVAPASLLGMNTDGRGRTEIYGESESRAVFSAEFSGAAERAIALSRAELRIAANEDGVRPLASLLARDRNGESIPDAAVPAYAAALAGSATRVAKFANLLPAERRASHDRLQYLLPGVLGVLLVLALAAVFVIFPALEQRRYRRDLERATRQIEPMVLRAQSLDRKIKSDRAKMAALDDFRHRPQADLDVLHELTRLLPPPVWTSAVEIYPDYAIVAGEADQAAPLLKVLDSSPLFQNSEFVLTPARNDKVEQFRIKTLRRGRTGRTTP
jgi:type II secretory pathway component PulL